jgi:DNA polymerase III alpha subunit
MPYIELHACSAFSFLRGASFPEQLAEIAVELEMPALALLDRNGVYGLQRFSVAARKQNTRPIIGSELEMEDGEILSLLVENRTGYKNLCELLTQAHLRSEKGKCAARWGELPQFAEGLIVFLGSARVSRVGFGVAPKRSFSLTSASSADERSKRKFAIARTRSPTRETRVLPRVREHARNYSPRRWRNCAPAYSRFSFAIKLALISAGQTASHS